MNPRLAKEFRALLLPWSIAVCAGLAQPLLLHLVRLRILHAGEFLGFVSVLAGFVFFACLLAIAAIPFGAEIQERTLPLLLSQPISRIRLWRDKLLVSFCSIAAAFLLQAAAYVILFGVHMPAESRVQFGVACAFVLPTLSSATFWTLAARSTLGGMVFTTSIQFLIFGILVFLLEQFGVSDTDSQGRVLIGAGIVYTALFFWLSGRKFSRLEVSQVSPDPVADSKSLATPGLRLTWLRCRPTSGVLNLVRKEIQLQKPIFMLAAVLCAVWIFVGLLRVLLPSRTTFAEIALVVSIILYIPLMALLGGCLSLSEEKNLGLTAWHLTFPISIRRQWAVKLAVGLATWFVLGMVLPYILASIGVTMSKRGILEPRTFDKVQLGTWFAISLFAGGVFAASFWAMTLFSNTLRAVIASLALISALCCAAALGCWLVVQLEGPQIFAVNTSQWDSYIWLMLTTAAALLALIQSLIQFRRLQTSPKLIAKYSCLLAAFVLLASFCYFLWRPFS